MDQFLAEIGFPDSANREPQTVSANVDRAAAAEPDRIAIRQYLGDGTLTGSLTFAELRDASMRMAGYLATKFGKGDPVGLWGNNSIAWVVSQLAILRIGGVVVTLDPALRAAELHHMLGVSQIRGLLMDREHRGVALEAILAEVRASVPSLEHVLLLEDWQSFVADAEPFEGDAAAPDDTALVVFTSGTTGRPKGVILHHAGVIGNSREAMIRTGLSDGRALLNPFPAYSVGGAVCVTLGALATLRPQIIINHFDAGVVIRLVEAEQIGWIPLNPAMMLPLLDHPEFMAEKFASLDAVWMGGTVITPEHVETARRALKVKVVTIYGQTESGGVHSVNMPDAPAEAISTTVGVPLPGGQIRIADLTTGETIARGAVGEIRTKSPYHARGYFRNEAATDELFDADGWMRTGDLGIIDDDGRLRITGRLKEMIIRGGRNIYPREIEDALCSFPGVAEAAVVGVPHPRWGEEIAVAVRATPETATLDLEAARAYLGNRIAAYKVPRMWRQVDDFPRGSQAKIRKVDLIPLFAEESAS